MQSTTKISRKEFYESTTTGIYINSSQPGVGLKTSGFIEYVVADSKNDTEKKVRRIGFYSANHKHLTDVKKDLEERDIKYVHLKGWKLLCQLIINQDINNEDILEMYNTIQKPKETICNHCDKKEDCPYIIQYLELKNPQVKVVLAPLELMNTKISPRLSMAYVDESADKTTTYDIGQNPERFQEFKKELLKISDNPSIDEPEPEVMYDGLIHGREAISHQQLLYFMKYLCENYGSDPMVTYLVDTKELYFIPIVNPDGYLYNEAMWPSGGGIWRKNRRLNQYFI